MLIVTRQVHEISVSCSAVVHMIYIIAHLERVSKESYLTPYQYFPMKSDLRPSTVPLL